jgi:hypothetical protein
MLLRGGVAVVIPNREYPASLQELRCTQIWIVKLDQNIRPENAAARGLPTSSHTDAKEGCKVGLRNDPIPGLLSIRW